MGKSAKSRDNSKNKISNGKGRSLTPNVTSSAKKYISQVEPVNVPHCPLNSSRYSKKTRDDISVEVANILNCHNNKMARQSSVGSHRYSSLDPTISNIAA